MSSLIHTQYYYELRIFKFVFLSFNICITEVSPGQLYPLVVFHKIIHYVAIVLEIVVIILNFDLLIMFDLNYVAIYGFISFINLVFCCIEDP